MGAGLWMGPHLPAFGKFTKGYDMKYICRVDAVSGDICRPVMSNSRQEENPFTFFQRRGTSDFIKDALEAGYKIHITIEEVQREHNEMPKT